VLFLALQLNCGGLVDGIVDLVVVHREHNGCMGDESTMVVVLRCRAELL
jgi:hypothetical protein